jgi:hypothetical protein
MTREEADRWYRSHCPGGEGHEYDGTDDGARWSKGDCYACIVDALAAPPSAEGEAHAAAGATLVQHPAKPPGVAMMGGATGLGWSAPAASGEAHAPEATPAIQWLGCAATVDRLNDVYDPGRAGPTGRRFVALGGPTTLYDCGADLAGDRRIPMGWWIHRGPDGEPVVTKERPSPAASPPSPAHAPEATAAATLRARIAAMTDEEKAGVVRRLQALSAEVEERDAKGLCDNCDGLGAEPDTASGIRLCPKCRAASPPSPKDADEGAERNEGNEGGGR